MPRTRVRDAWKKTSDDGSAREGASTQQAEEAGDAAASAPNADDPASSDDETPKRPNVGDPKAAWVAYAESQGLEDADSFTKAELVEEYGG